MDEEEDTCLKEHEEGINHLICGIREAEIDEGERNSLQDNGSEGEGFVKEDLNIQAMDSRTYTDGCSPIYVGDIEIPIEEMDTSTHSFEHEDEDLVASKKCTR